MIALGSVWIGSCFVVLCANRKYHVNARKSSFYQQRKIHSDLNQWPRPFQPSSSFSADICWVNPLLMQESLWLELQQRRRAAWCWAVTSHYTVNSCTVNIDAYKVTLRSSSTTAHTSILPWVDSCLSVCATSLSKHKKWILSYFLFSFSIRCWLRMNRQTLRDCLGITSQSHRAPKFLRLKSTQWDIRACVCAHVGVRRKLLFVSKPLTFAVAQVQNHIPRWVRSGSF